MTKKPKIKHDFSKEYLAELLKERIYATLALLAILIDVDTNELSPEHAAVLISGTIISLWAASIVSSLMARRVIYQDGLDHEREREDQLRKHAPMLAALVFPLTMVILAMLEVFSLSTAVNISIGGSLLLLIGWSVMSARSLNAKKTPTFILVGAELLIGLAIVSLKVVLKH